MIVNIHLSHRRIAVTEKKILCFYLICLLLAPCFFICLSSPQAFGVELTFREELCEYAWNMLDSPNQRWKNKALSTIGLCCLSNNPGHGAIEAYKSILSTQNKFDLPARLDFILSLAQFNPEFTRKYFEDVLHKEAISPAEKLIVARYLLLFDTSQGEKILEELLSCTNPFVKRDILNLVRTHRLACLYQKIASTHTQDDSDFVKYERVLAQIVFEPPESVISSADVALSSDSCELIVKVAYTGGKVLLTGQHKKLFRKYLSSPNSIIRRYAINTVGALDLGEFAEDLYPCLEDEDPLVREEVLTTCISMGSPPPFDSLTKAYKKEHEYSLKSKLLQCIALHPSHASMDFLKGVWEKEEGALKLCTGILINAMNLKK
jgi:hypothetical protein